MYRVLNILPHPGGGGERVVDMLEEMGGGFEHRKAYLARARSPLVAASWILVDRPSLLREARAADVVHVIGDTGALIALSLLRERPSVFGTHGLHRMRRVRGPVAVLVRRRMRSVLRAATVVACTSQPELRELKALEADARLELVLNGIALPAPVHAAERARVREQLRLPPDAFAVLYLGELEARKHPLTAAEAVLALDRSGEQAVLLAAGDGPLRPDLERLTGPAVRVLGFRDDTEQLLAAADAFVMPSEREGLSLALLEAMGRGLPVVVSDGVGNPETVGDAGIVVPLGDASALAEQLRRLAQDPSERSRFGHAARRRVESAFALERWQADMRRVFATALELGATAPAPAAGDGRV
jgi:glycosyltransferase involved in cell wall biosynthesis